MAALLVLGQRAVERDLASPEPPRIPISLNRPNPSADGTLSLLGNWEWFVPITDQHERSANKRRYRGGVGYRRNRSWGLAVLYIRANSRNTIDDPFSTSENILDVHVKRAW